MSTSHKGTAQLIAVLHELLAHGGWLSQRQLFKKTGVPRATLAPMLDELEQQAWVEKRSIDDSHVYCLGPGLPRIGLSWLDTQAQAAERLKARTDAACTGANRAS